MQPAIPLKQSRVGGLAKDPLPRRPELQLTAEPNLRPFPRAIRSSESRSGAAAAGRIAVAKPAASADTSVSRRVMFVIALPLCG